MYSEAERMGRETTRYVADVYRSQAQARAGATAILAQRRRISFSALDRRSNRVAQALLAARVRPGDRVSILSRSCPEFFEILGGAAKVRACLAPINFRLAAPEITYILTDMAPRVLFVDAEFLPLAIQATVGLQTGPRMVLINASSTEHLSYERWRDAAQDQDPRMPPSPDDDAFLLYTSGTTGRAKGVRISNSNYDAMLGTMSQVPGFSYIEGETIACPMPLFHIAGINAAVAALHQGCRILLMRSFAPEEFLALVERHHVHRVFLAPAMILTLLRAAQGIEANVSSLRMIAYGAAPIGDEVLRAARKRFGCEFAQLYGLTESTGAGTYLPWRDHLRSGKQGSCGLPWPGLQLRVVDEYGRDAGVGKVGEIVISGRYITPGYRNNLAATTEATRDGWLHTGDAGLLDKDGYLFIRDRIKDMIVTGAENVYPAEVESAILGCPGVADVAVIGIPSERWGEEVKAFVVCAPGMSPSAAEIIAWAKRQIGSFKAPKSVDFVSQLPRNAGGKILKRELRKPYWEGRSRQVS